MAEILEINAHMDQLVHAEKMNSRISSYIEKLLVISLSGLAITIFIGWKDVGLFNLFSLLSLSTLLVWRYIIKYELINKLPMSVLITSILFILYAFISALLSDDRHFAFVLFKHYKFILIGGLLFIAPLREQYRKYIIVIFFMTAAFAGLIGILQYFGFMQVASDRPDGFSANPNFYAGILAIVCSSAIIMILLPKTYLITSKKGYYFLVAIVVFALSGIILSQSRSMWIALVTTCIATLFLYDRRKAFIFLLSFIIVATVFIASNNILKQRALSIATSIYTEDENGSTSIRIALWKGGLLIFKASPLLGTGLGDFERDIEKLVIEKKLKSPVISHAHNIYLQVLATRGIIGLAILLSLFTCLIRWGMNRIRDQRGIGGHIIILTTILIMVGGLTDNHIELPRFLAAYCFTIGLIGPSCLIKETFSAA